MHHGFSTWQPAALALLLAALLAVPACGPGTGVPDPDSEAYRRFVRDFHSAVARIQTGQEPGAEERLRQAAEIAPGEPAVWYNLAVLAARRNELDRAAEVLARAREIAPEAADVWLLSGRIEQERNNVELARSDLESAVKLDSSNVRALFTLARFLVTHPAPEAALDPATLLDRVLDLRPDNTVAILDRLRLAADRGEANRFAELLTRLESLSADWPEDIRDQVRQLRNQADAAEAPESLAAAVVRVANVMKPVDAHREDIADLDIILLDPRLVMTRTLVLPPPSGRPSPADTALAFERAPPPPDPSRYDWIGTVFLSDQGPLARAAANQELVRIDPEIDVAFPGRAGSPLPDHPVAFLDYDYDFRMDVAAAGAGGLRIYRQGSTGEFRDRTETTTLPSDVTTDEYTGIWALDVDLEGDMDLVASTAGGTMRLIRNNGDDTFTARPIFQPARNVRELAWADVDNDGDPDAVLRGAGGTTTLFRNERSGLFTREPLESAEQSLALAIADIEGDGWFDLLTLNRSGEVSATSWDSGSARSRTLFSTGETPRPASQARIFTADLDNNGGLDIVVSTDSASALWLQTANRRFMQHTVFAGMRLFEAADLSISGKLNLLGLDAGGQTVRLLNMARNDYLSRTVLPRAAGPTGDRRINPFGIGGEIEIRSQLLYQKRVITSPLVHFGLGTRELTDVARIIWPNGTSQAQFDLESDQTLIARESLKGSCPWVFTYDGDRMHFVTDFIWRSPLGLRINAVETAGIATTEDWIKIDGDELAPRDGVYDVRITAELWETHFFDQIALRAVDHPVGTEVWVDEVFVFPPNPLTIHVTGETHAVNGAWDDQGATVADRVGEVDGQYVDSFELYSHQGLTKEHFVEIDLSDVPYPGPLKLIASGWIRPTDSSINVAIDQGDHPRPHGVRLDVLGEDGSWTTFAPDLGFPSGKSKTMIIDLDGAFDGTSQRRVRLVTNLEIYWDAMRWAEGLDPTVARTTDLRTASADLRYRGYSLVLSDRRSMPETPVYDSLQATGQIWRDLVGFYTRFGDVRELLETVDDRYVIMNAGDEIAMTFSELPPPPDGWTRDFVLVGDGWVKDGDYNTTFSRTVLPLPEHATSSYVAPLLRLEDNPAYRKHPEDWEQYHTRYVAPDFFSGALSSRD